MNNRYLPTELETVVGAEKIDFSVFSRRNKPAGQAMGTILFGVIWSAITSIFVAAFFGPLFKGEEVHFGVDGVPTSGSLENFEPLLFPALFIGVFVLIGIGALLWGFYSFFQKGGYFVGTASRLLRYRKGNISSYDWEQFTGNMKMNTKKGDITLELQTGKMVKSKNSPTRYVPDTVYISGATDVLEIEKICRKRIKENG
jgi:hypothetical protein